MAGRKKKLVFEIEDGCGTYLLMTRVGKFRYIVAETRGRSKAQLERLERLVEQANGLAGSGLNPEANALRKAILGHD